VATLLKYSATQSLRRSGQRSKDTIRRQNFHSTSSQSGSSSYLGIRAICFSPVAFASSPTPSSWPACRANRPREDRPGEVDLGEVETAQARVRQVGPYIGVRHSPRVPAVPALSERRQMGFVGHRLLLRRQSYWQVRACQTASGGELGADQALGIPQIRSRQVSVIKMRHAKVGAAKISLSQ
jgi:hypothetical protein